MKPLVIYHADCTDGFGAAFAAWLALGDEAEYLPMQYNADVYLDASLRDVYILDFSFNREIMEGLFQRAKRVVWLDHHKTAFEMWCGKYEKGMSFTDCHNGHDIILDDNKSGALLAWEWFHGAEVPMLIKHIDDLDRWQFKLDGSRELHAALASYKPWNFEQWRTWWRDFTPSRGGSTTALSNFKAKGAAILRAQDAHVQSMLKRARKCGIDVPQGIFFDPVDGKPIPESKLFLGLALNTPSHMSEVGHALANQSGTFGLVWYLGADRRVKCSLRSNGEYDVSAIARAFGGGGHRNAAGFETDIETLMGWLK